MSALRSHPWYQGVLLGGFCLVAAAALAWGQRLTAPAIAAAARADLAASFDQVVPATLRDNDMTADTVTVPGGAAPTVVYRARKGGEVSAVAYRVIGQGYGGEIELVIGLDRMGEILGVRVIRHAETPGLGDRIDARKSDWIAAFTGRSRANTPESQWAVKKDGGSFDQFSGATITPRAVVKAVKAGLDLFDAHRAEMLAAEPPPRQPETRP